MNFNWNNVKPACCAKWLVLPTVYSDALSYGEQLDKFCYQLNQLIENNNILPDFITEMVKEYINSGAIGEVVRDILGDYILNVKYPPEGIMPAVGDGTSDDTEAIQGCIDYAAENGGVVYFPYGSYLTQPLTMKDGVSLFGFDRYSTKIVLKGGATKPLIGGTAADLSIANLSLDGNSGIQVNDVNVVTIMGNNVLFTNLIIKDGYTLVNYVGSGGHFQISDVVFGNAVERCLLTTGNADVQCENVVFNQLSAVGGVSVMDIGTDGGYFNGVKSVATCNQCIVINGNNNKISAIVENATTPFVDNGDHNNIDIVGVGNKKYYSNDIVEVVEGNRTSNIGGNSTKIINGNSAENCYNKVETVEGDCDSNIGGNSTKIINGNSTENCYNKVETVEGDCDSNIGGNLTKIINGNSVETITKNKTITAEKATENYTQGKTITGKNLFIDTEEPLKYGTVENGLVKMEDNTGSTYYLVTDKRKEKNNTLYNEFLIDPIVSHVRSDYSEDSDATIKTLTANQIYSLYDNIAGGELIKTSIGTDNEGETIYSYKHTARIKKNATISTYFSDKVNSKCLFMVSGQHGTEKIAILTLFRWLNDEYKKTYSYVLDNYDIIVVPCASPYNINNNLYYNQNGVNPNRNFPIGFTPSSKNGQTALDQKQCKSLYDFLASTINTYGLSLIVMNFHNSDYYTNYPSESNVLWFNVSTNSIDMENYNNLFKATNVMKREILEEYPELNGQRFLRFLSTDSDGTLGGQCAGMGVRFVLTETPCRWTEDGVWFDEKSSYIAYLIVYNTIKAMVANEYFAPYNVVFNSLSQIGCSVNNTLIEVCQKLPITCGVKTLVGGGKTNNLSKSLPDRNIFSGLLEIYKEHESDRCSIKFSVADGTNNAISWSASYDTDYGLSNWQPMFAEMSNVNFNHASITYENLVARIGNSAVIRVVSSMALYSILPVADSGMLFVYAPILPSDFSSRIRIAFFVSDSGGFYMNNNNTPNKSNWITIKEPA